jgi:hypothetical protein
LSHSTKKYQPPPAGAAEREQQQKALRHFLAYAGAPQPPAKEYLDGDEGWLNVTFNDAEGLRMDEWHGFGDRHHKLKGVIETAHAHLPASCHGSFMVYTGDRPSGVGRGMAYYGVAVRPEDAEARGFPDYHFGWGFDSEVSAARAAAAAPPNDTRVFWKGSRHPVRERLFELAAQQEHAGLFDVQAMQWHNPNFTFATLAEHCKYAALLDVAGNGNGYSGRIKELLHCGRPVLIQHRQNWDWPLHKMQAWVHYVPVAEDLSDLVDKVRWLRDNPAVARAIGEDGLRFAGAHATRRAAEKRIVELMLRECSGQST